MHSQRSGAVVTFPLLPLIGVDTMWFAGLAVHTCVLSYALFWQSHLSGDVFVVNRPTMDRLSCEMLSIFFSSLRLG